MAGVEDEFQVPLLGPRGQARGRPGPLGIDHDDRRLRHACKRDALRHQGEPPAGGGHHGPKTRIRGPEGHVQRRNLVFGLLKMNGDLPRDGGEVVQDRRGGRHGVSRRKLAAPQESPERKSLVPVELAVIARLRGEDLAAFEPPADGELPAFRQGPAGRLIGRGRLHRRGVGAETGEDQAGQDGARGRDILKGFRRLRFDLPDPFRSDEDAPLLQGGAMPPLCFRAVHGDHHVPGFAAEGVNRPLRHADHMVVVAAPDPRHVVLGREEMVPQSRESLRELKLDGKHPLPGLPSDQDIELHGDLLRAVGFERQGGNGLPLQAAGMTRKPLRRKILEDAFRKDPRAPFPR
ncbi:MAG: hypothetical protein A4E67_00179 [Syntrophaceae bacterium PtaB.Bin038]|nr:MAG: hypothetical protein A4E67_00179 [Syntrophaceae bacterium PtaB.Bin038]